MHYDVVAFGEPIIDFFALPASPCGNPVYEAFPGGGAANVLSQVRAFGGRAALVGVVGSDRFGDFLLNRLAVAGIDASAILRTPGVNTGMGFVHLGEGGERSFTFYRNTEGKGVALADGYENVLRNATLFHFTSVSMANAPSREATLRAAAAAKRFGAGLSFDVNYRSSIWNGRDDEARRRILTALEGVAIVKLSEEECDFLFPGADSDRCADALHRLGVAFVAVSQGPRGNYFSFAGGRGGCPGFPVDAVDTTGCGDAFAGALLSQLARRGGAAALGGMSLDEVRAMLAKANAAGALCASRQGSFTIMPDEADVEALLGTRRSLEFL